MEATCSRCFNNLHCPDCDNKDEDYGDILRAIDELKEDIKERAQEIRESTNPEGYNQAIWQVLELEEVKQNEKLCNKIHAMLSVPIA